MTFDETCGFCTGTVQKPLGRPQLSPALGPFLFRPPKATPPERSIFAGRRWLVTKALKFRPARFPLILRRGLIRFHPLIGGIGSCLSLQTSPEHGMLSGGFGRDILICSKIPIKKIYLQPITGLPFSALHHIRSL